MIEESLVYLHRKDTWLFLLRNKKKDDVNKGKWIGVGGKREKNETMEECAIRETCEETGYQIQQLTKEGTLFFHFPKRETEYMEVFSSGNFTGTQTQCFEGSLAWVKEKDIFSLNLWEGDRLFLADMLQKSHTVFTYHLFYNEKGTLTDYKKEG